jgi:hypothetical protein
VELTSGNWYKKFFQVIRTTRAANGLGEQYDVGHALAINCCKKVKLTFESL